MDKERDMLRGSCFASVPSSAMELTSADFVILCSLGNLQDFRCSGSTEREAARFVLLKSESDKRNTILKEVDLSVPNLK